MRAWQRLACFGYGGRIIISRSQFWIPRGRRLQRDALPVLHQAIGPSYMRVLAQPRTRDLYETSQDRFHLIDLSLLAGNDLTAKFLDLRKHFAPIARDLLRTRQQQHLSHGE